MLNAASNETVVGDESRFIDNLTGVKPDDAPANITKHDGLESHNFFAIMRHCQRADTHKGVFDNWLVKTDPPLTPEGEKQAKLLAKYYTDYWKTNNMTFDKVIIETSPFMRCI